MEQILKVAGVVATFLGVQLAVHLLGRRAGQRRYIAAAKRYQLAVAAERAELAKREAFEKARAPMPYVDYVGMTERMAVGDFPFWKCEERRCGYATVHGERAERHVLNTGHNVTKVQK